MWPTKPMLANTREEPFSDREWLYEVKWDGIRCILHMNDGKVRLQSRNLKDITKTYPEVEESTDFLDAESAVIDGEIVALEPSGKSSFKLLQTRMHLQSDDRIRSGMKNITVTLYAFDLLYLDGQMIMDRPLEERKNLLQQIMTEYRSLKYSDHVQEEGEEFYQAARDRGIEGVMAKRMDSEYRPGIRSSQWLKIRIEKREEFVIGGWTPGRGGRKGLFGALLLGQYDKNDLQYSGKVGTGFGKEDLEAIRNRLEELEISERLFVEDPGEKGARWTKPELVCDVRLMQRTDEALRFPVFLGLRDDRDPKSVRVPDKRPSGNSKLSGSYELGRVHLSNSDKEFWSQRGYTKFDLFNYYLEISKYILPHLKDRPLTLHRQPDGTEDEGFYQRNLPDSAPDWMESINIDREDQETIRGILCRDPEALAWLANMGAIEIHPWLARIDSLERPDLIIFDLDPVYPARYADSCQVALKIRDLLFQVGLRPYVKTSGKRGLHVYLPIMRNLDFDQSRAFVREIGRRIDGDLGESFTMSRKPSQKEGKVFMDPAQNGWGRSLVSAYSLRPTVKATVSTPITWEECGNCVKPERFDMKSVPRRLKNAKDPWRDMFQEPQDVKEVLGIPSF